MAGRIRTLKPEILENRRTGRLTDEQWRLFVSMILLADDHGNLYGDPEQISSVVFWSGAKRDIREALASLSRASLIRLYEVREQPYIAILGWSQHQRIDRPSHPRVPGPNRVDTEETASGSRGTREGLATDHDLRSPISDHDLDPDPDHEHSSPPAPPATPSASLPVLPDALTSAGIGQEHAAPKRRARPKPAATSQYDLEAIYALYPRRGDGKARGLEHLARSIASPDDYEQALRAARHYADKVAAEQTPLEYVPHFSTWARQHWRDYVDGPHIVRRNGAAATKSRWHEPRPAVEKTREVDLMALTQTGGDRGR